MQEVSTALPAAEPEFGRHAKHVKALVAPTATEYVPALQSVQTAAPASTLYFPATHSEHVPPEGPVEPGLQMQSIFSLLASDPWEFVGHSLHKFEVAPTSVEY